MQEEGGPVRFSRSPKESLVGRLLSGRTDGHLLPEGGGGDRCSMCMPWSQGGTVNAAVPAYKEPDYTVSISGCTRSWCLR